MMQDSEKRKILAYSRNVLEAAFGKIEEPKFPCASALFEEKRGIFVTLKKNGNLRGCIGQIIGYQPLKESLREMTLAAAFEDPRFPELEERELPFLKIHISLLTMPMAVASYHQIRVGVDGIIISCGRKKGVYLPEVATEMNWDSKMFFTSCALEKAGLTTEELGKARIEVFQTEDCEESGESGKLLEKK